MRAKPFRRLKPGRLMPGLALAFLLLGLVPVASAAPFATLTGMHVAGYQGWFACPADRDPRGWVHWFRGRQQPSTSSLTVDLWPDMAELPPAERCPTSLRLPSGEDAPVFSSANAQTVRRHFRWMRQYGIDGAAVERFVSEIADPALVQRPTTVLRNIRAAAEAEGRGFFVMYDLSGPPAGQLLSAIEADWKRLTEQDDITASPAYMHHRGRPVVALWGVGFTHVKLDPQTAQKLIAFFRARNVTLMAGVPSYWRTRERDALPDPAWKAVYAAFDILSPWTVGRFRSPAEAAAFGEAVMKPDIVATREAGQDYMPVVFPGFSWFNLRQGKAPLDQIPRLCGAFYNAQVRSALAVGATMLFTAMFDEVDEGTAIFKLEQDPGRLPAGATLLIPDRGSACAGGNDLYLKLAGEATRALRGRASPPQ